MNYRPKFFILQELVPPEVFEERGEAAWELLNPYALLSADQLREHVGPIIFNNWHAGGSLKESFLCSPGSAFHAKWSQHKFGNAGDAHPQKVTAAEMHAGVLAHPELFPYITTLEDILSTPSWVHFDCRNNKQVGIRIVKPK